MARGLAALKDIGKLVPTASELKELGWASAGGAAGFVGASFLMGPLSKAPLIGSLPKQVHQVLLGVVGAQIAGRWNDDFAKGLAGGLVGHALASWAMKFLGGSLDLAGLGDVYGYLGGEAITAVPGAPGDEELGGDSMGELEPTQQFRGFGDPSIEEQQQLAGTFLS